MARFFQYHPHIAEADAIGYSMRALHRVLRQAGHAAFLVYSAPPAGGAGGRDLHHLSELAQVSWRPDDVLILHHSFASPDLGAVLGLPVRKALVYHNITPARFFTEAGMPSVAEEAETARRQLAEIVGSVQVAIGDSDYNSAELAAFGYDNRATIPVFYDDAFFRSRELDWQLFDEVKTAARTNIVFIGRLVPNKRIDRVIETTATYARLFGRDVRLHLIGKHFVEGYTARLLAQAAELQVLGLLRFHAEAEPLRLKTLLAAADAFVCFSEHEGFMVPIVEAFAVGCPVVARRAAAVGETMGGAGLAVDDPDPALAAGLVELLRRDEQTRRRVRRDQFGRALYFRSDATAQRWQHLLQREFDVGF